MSLLKPIQTKPNSHQTQQHYSIVGGAKKFLAR